MPDCQKCGNHFPCTVKIDGKKRSLTNRKYCLDCSPFGLHNTRQIDRREGDERECRYCKRKYRYKTVNGGRRNSSTTCQTCLSSIRRYKTKIKAIDYKGGKCVACGYDGHLCPGAMNFHHLDPHSKDFTISSSYGLSWDRLTAELDKCDLYCCRCHAELHWTVDERRLKFERKGVDTQGLTQAALV